MSMQNKTFFCKVVFDGPEYIVNKFNPSKLHNIISYISTYYKFADFY